ncbi:antiviral reverse transcriptase Drt3a [Shewanella sp. SM23]|uniref:antiviral reverse transcriptase Drt3a n=1 Tax=Shewanella sp. SM23 TaxID=2912794 RepID=UPI0021DAA207|nr:antiviral reverse transcriptase Drt3a [Shewanella sp. SM23]MCU8083098.1 RNA-directed DNA polymerase [Shewanella sp. SM23]
MSDKYKSQYLTRVRFVNLCDKFKYSPLCIPYAFEIVAGSRSISDGFSILNFRGKPILSINDEHSKLVINHVSELLKELYEVKQGNRHKIVANVVQMLGENSEKYVFRYDIKKFYESIHPEYIYRMVISDPAISPNSKALVRMYLKGIEDKGIFGVGRGTSLSAALAEYYLLDFDKVIRRIDGVYYYARFVDDIIVFSYKKVENFKDIVQSKLPVGMILHERKDKKSEVSFVDDAEWTFSYLGYKFTANKKRLIKIDFSDNKVEKIKSRLVKSFMDYGKNKDERLLITRIKYLTGNRFIQLSNGLAYTVGFYSSYRNINPSNSDGLRELDNFYKKIIYSKSFRVNKLIPFSMLSQKGLNFVKNVSFLESYKSKPYYYFSNINRVKRCWSNE